jgi:hypothetical protein
MNLPVLGGDGVRAIARAVVSSESLAVNWSSKGEMLDAFDAVTRLAVGELRTAP